MGFGTFYRGHRSEEERAAAKEFNKEKRAERLGKDATEMALQFNLSSAELKNLGLDEKAESKAKEEKAEVFLQKQLALLIQSVSNSKTPKTERASFHLPDYESEDKVDSYYLEEAFKKLANLMNEKGQPTPRRVLGDRQLKLVSRSQEQRSGGYYTTEVDWALSFEPYDAAKPIKPTSL